MDIMFETKNNFIKDLIDIGIDIIKEDRWWKWEE